MSIFFTNDPSAGGTRSFTMLKTPTPDEINAEYKPYQSICARFRKLESLTYDQVIELEEDFTDYANYYKIRLGFLAPMTVFPDDFARIARRKKTLLITDNLYAKVFYNIPFEFKKPEIVNGYKLWTTSSNDNNDDNLTIMSFEAFKKCCEMWNEPNISKKKFKKLLRKHLCSDWRKMDRHGKSFAGFWRYPKDSDEYVNAGSLTLEDNIQGLLELPYPYKVIIQTIKWGCENRQECVRYSNFICEWVKRKREIVYGSRVPSLQDYARGVAEKEKFEIPYFLKQDY